MRNGARPRRKSSAVAPDLSQSPEIQSPEIQSPEVRPPEDEFAARGAEDVVELPVRVPIEAPRGDPIELPDAAPEAESAQTLDMAAMPEAVDRGTAAETPRDEAPASESDPGNGAFVVLVEVIEPPGANAAEPPRANAAEPPGANAAEPPGANAAELPGSGPVHAAAPTVADPATEIRFARLHLRTGSLHQARSEYESLAGNNLLDVPATLDLAEVRWRTGDLVGAGSAAAAYLAADGQSALGFLIAAEAAAAQGQVADARRHAGRALERSVASLEVFFAGVPRRMSWPESMWAAPAAIRIDASSPTAMPDRAVPSPVMAEPTIEAPEGSLWAQTEELSVPEPEVQLPVPEPHSWDGEVTAGTAALQAGDALMAALHFAVALRMSPESARAVVDGIGEHRDLALELVGADALRLLGNGSDAGEARASVASVLGKPRAAAQPPAVQQAPAAQQAPASGPAPEPAPEPAASQPDALSPAAQPAATAPEPAVPASKAASTPEPAKEQKADELPPIVWE